MKKQPFHNKTPFILLSAILLFALQIPGNTALWAAPDIVAKLRLYEGLKTGSPAPPEVVASYHLKRIDKNDVTSEPDMEKEKHTLRKIFNLTDIQLISSAGLQFGEGQEHAAIHVVMVNGRKLQVKLTALEKNSDRFNVAVETLGKEGATRPLLESALKLPQSRTTVLGFEDSGGRNYFLSFHRAPNAETSSSDILSGIKKIPGQKKPKIINSVQPEYPKDALKAEVSGVVIIEAAADIHGRVVEANVLSGHPLLREAALAAIKQWIYEPYADENGKICPVRFTVAIKFNLNDDKSKTPINLTEEQKPRLIKKVNPEYPKEALKNHVEGLVMIEALIDTRGNVSDIKVSDGRPELTAAAVDAVKQWVYEPYLVNGEAHPVRFTVVVKFALNANDKSPASPNAKMLSAREKPKQLSAALPVYPPEALKQHQMGEVALELEVDPSGAVTAAKVLDGPEIFRKAALDAVRQWRYEPYKENGKPVPVRFSVLVKFKLEKK